MAQSLATQDEERSLHLNLEKPAEHFDAPEFLVDQAPQHIYVDHTLPALRDHPNGFHPSGRIHALRLHVA